MLPDSPALLQFHTVLLCDVDDYGDIGVTALDLDIY